jgi:ribosomal protein S18 acetylase RimI-like enzyme
MQSFLATADGATLRVRPLERRDRAALAEGFARLGPESRYRRFASPVPRLSERQLDRLVDLDHHEREALVAYDPASGEGLAIARWAPDPGHPGVAEIALTVMDAWQSRGVGTGLAAMLLERARAEGLNSLRASVLADNRRASAILQRLGFRFAARSGPQVEYALELAPDGAS